MGWPGVATAPENIDDSQTELSSSLTWRVHIAAVVGKGANPELPRARGGDGQWSGLRLTSSAAGRSRAPLRSRT